MSNIQVALILFEGEGGRLDALLLDAIGKGGERHLLGGGRRLFIDQLEELVEEHSANLIAPVREQAAAFAGRELIQAQQIVDGLVFQGLFNVPIP